MSRVEEGSAVSARVLEALRRARQQIEALEAARREPIAIVGMGCRFPGGAHEPEAFWRLLVEGVDASIDYPAGRFDWARYYDPEPARPGHISFRRGAFLGEVDRFDAAYFGISPREARDLDPQHRLLLEVSCEALERAALAPDELRGSRTGVFVGITQNDYASQFSCYEDPAGISTYSGTGNMSAFAAGRLSHRLGLRGPSLVVDTACSSSLVAIHLACQSLRSRESDVCIAGAAHLVLAPEVSIFLSQSRAVSPDGRSRAFDAAANGFSRGEGCGVLVLRRLSDAIAERHHVVAVIRGSSVNHDGESGGLTVPSEVAQRLVVARALEVAGVEPTHVGYVEAHGTGTRLGDPIEVGALRAALCERRTREQPLFIGSVKSNIGHLEAAAGVAGVIKVALALEAGELPPQINFEHPNPLIDWADGKLRVATRSIPFPAPFTERIAGVSAFGMSGTNAHAILSAAPELPPADEQPSVGRQRPLAYLLPLSARSAAALDVLSARHASWHARSEQADLASYCYTAAVGRAHLRQRRCLVARSTSELGARLRALGDRAVSAPDGADCFEGAVRSAPRVGVLIGELRSPIEPTPSLSFHPAYVRRLDAIPSLLGAAASDDSSVEASLARAFRHGLATAALASSLGLSPVAVAGVGRGRALAAHLAGLWSAPEAFARASGKGGGFPSSVARLPLVDADGWHEGPAGARGELCAEAPGALERALAALRAHGTPWVLLLGPGTLRLLGPGDRAQGPLEVEDSGFEAMRALGRLYAEGAAIDWAELYRGSGLHRLVLPTYPFERERHWASPLRRERPLPSALPLLPTEHPLLGRELSLPGSSERRFETPLSRARPAWLEEHVIGGRVVAPGALFLASFLEAARICLEPGPFALEDVCFLRALSLEDASGVEAQVILVAGGDGLELRWMARALGSERSAWQLHATARAVALPAGARESAALGADDAPGAPSSASSALAALRRRCTIGDSPERVNAALAAAGARLGPFFRWHAELWRAGSEILCGLSPAAARDAPSLPPTPPLSVGLLDSCFQLLAVPAPGEARLAGVPAPVHVRRLSVYPGEVGEPVWCHVEDRERGSFRLLSDGGVLLLEAEGVTFRALDAERGFLALVPEPNPETPRAFVSARASVLPHLARLPGLFVSTWPERPASAAPSGARDWVVVSDTELRVESLIAALEARGDRAQHWPLHVEIEPGALRERLSAWLGQRPSDEVGVVFLSGLGPSPARGSGARAIELTIEPATERSCSVALGLIQALAAPAAGLAPRLCLVTRGARAVTPGAALPGLARAALWGLARAVPLEEPRLRCVAIDLEPEGHALSAGEAAALARELAVVGTESAVALRGGVRHVERLVTLPWPAHPPPLIRSGASYLITGGLGGLGLALCRSLVERGARHVVLSSRSDASPDAAASVERLRARGVTLLCAALDVSQPRALATLLERIRRELPPLDGVFHAAGVVEDALLRTQSDAGLLRVLGPKLRGAWNLHQQTQGEALSHFVSFSSLASLCGSPGQAAYGAANAFLDALAHHRRQQGLCALSVNFGAFARVGMAARQTRHETERRARWGLGAMEPEAGLQAMYQLLGGELAQVGVAHVDADAWLSESSPYHALSLLETLGAAPDSLHSGSLSARTRGPAARVTELQQGRLAPGLAELSTASAASRSARLLQHVRERVAQTLSMVSADAVEVEVPLLELGMDSLMGVELAHRLGADLGLRLASTLVFDCPTAAALAAELELQWGLTRGEPGESESRPAAPAAAAPSPHPAARRPASGHALRADLEQLSDEQLRALVDEMVARR